MCLSPLHNSLIKMSVEKVFSRARSRETVNMDSSENVQLQKCARVVSYVLN